MRSGFDKWWVLPLSILAASALIALSIVVLKPSLTGHSFAEVARRATSEPTTDCSGALSTDYACYQERYQSLVRDSGVEAAFAKFKDEHAKNDFVKSNCHQLAHAIGRAAAERYGDLPGAFGHGEHFCGSGYYHGVLETIVAQIGLDRMLDEADALCADPRERQEHSAYHYECAHGLGHGFMRVLENELFEALGRCDALADGWERERCYGGVFMENVMVEDDPSHPYQYLKANEPLYPCTEVETKYKTQCYVVQTSYALEQSGDFSEVFDLCEDVEVDYRPTCYRGLGGYASVWSIQHNVTEVGQAGAANMLCALGGDHEARSNCVVGAVATFADYRGDAQAKAFCESYNEDLRTLCLQASEEYYKIFRIR